MEHAPRNSGKRRFSAAWPPFADRLAAVLSSLTEDQFLIISVKGSNRFVQFAAQGSFGMRAETTSNAYLARSEQLDAQQTSALIASGWAPATAAPLESTPEEDPDGSPNFFVEWPHPVPFDAVAQFAVHTLAEVLRVPYPGFLQYDAGYFFKSGMLVELPALGLKRAERPREPGQEPDARQRLLVTMRGFSGFADLAYNDDGDIVMGYGSTVAFLRVVGEPPQVRIYSALVTDVDQTDGLLACLNEINAMLGQLHVYFHDGTIFAVSDLPAAPFITEHIARGAYVFFHITDGIDELLQAEFGGRVACSERVPSLLKH